MGIGERYDFVLAWFVENMPSAASELNYANAYQLLVAVILSAQCTDKRVNMTTPALFARFPDAASLAVAEPEEIYEYIKSISYPNNKARNLSGMARMLTNEMNGELPRDARQMERLPGVGRKTANVVASVLFDQSVMPVDTHVFRVANRVGLARGKTPRKVEDQLTAHIAPELLPRAHHWLILHGRYVCTARAPRCDECGIRPACRKMEKTGIGG